MRVIRGKSRDAWHASSQRADEAAAAGNEAAVLWREDALRGFCLFMYNPCYFLLHFLFRGHTSRLKNLT